ncbi:pyridoxal phosphate-dependent aminotransferase [Evansella cellulosilytica]|uniref:Aminotransferase n=1 Tax=Evansella cellulosilytica (strain ATCC 21833 / DSM 2522 / FERM P-1141 / JCM 9156 / N-4) TaxID=649639 RepID=E6TTV6_EVAC2|nr:pyridoxal phosphate-dependent aminotransferase [Evansella cellulosilytica]ADU31987.1 aminotransferase class I and II [Evansella cellulosilytica DSM 2522]
MKALSISRNDLPRSGIREIMDVSSTMKDVIHLEVGEPNEDTPQNIRIAATEAMNSGFTHYTPNAGLPSLRTSIVKHVYDKYEIVADPSQVIITPGAVTAIAVALLALVDAGEEVLIPDPGWPNYEQMLISQGAVPVRYPLIPQNEFSPNFDKLEQLVSSKTKAIIINSPGNPTGGVLNEYVLKKVLSFASKQDLYVISDEVYDGIVFETKHVCPFSLDNEDRVISIFGFSKNYAMTGWRVGYAIAPPHIAPLMTKLLEPLVSCASSVSQKAAEEAINGPQDFVTNMREIYRSRKDKVTAMFSDAGVKVFEPKGAFYMLIDVSNININRDEVAIQLLNEDKVAVAPGITFGPSTKEMIRISLATEERDLIEGVKRICRFIKRHRIEGVSL